MVRAGPGVVAVSKTKSIACAVLMWSMSHCGGLLAEGIDSTYGYRPLTLPANPYSSYRWRPPSNDVYRSEYEVPDDGTGKERLPGTVRTPNPRSMTYRPLNEGQSRSSRVGEFRFRAISPEERTDSGKAEISHSNLNNSRYPVRPKFRELDDKASFRSFIGKHKYRFRPDQRFSSGQTMGDSHLNSPSPTYPPIYKAPVFRQDDRFR